MSPAPRSGSVTAGRQGYRSLCLPWRGAFPVTADKLLREAVFKGPCEQGAATLNHLLGDALIGNGFAISILLCLLNCSLAPTRSSMVPWRWLGP
jgi:hypothetical protein